MKNTVSEIMKLKLRSCDLILIFVLSLFVLVLTAGNSSAETIIVDDDGEGDYMSIGEAIDNSHDRDVIRVWAGIYREKLIIDHPLIIQGNGSSSTIIQGNGRENVVSLQADNITLSGFGISGSGVYTGDSGVRIHSGANNNQLLDNFIFNNSNAVNIGWATRNVLANNTIFRNQEYGILIKKGRKNLLENNTISRNRVGIHLSDWAAENRVHYNDIYQNTHKGIYCGEDQEVEVNATNNWWGHGSGPYHTVNNSKGDGDQVTDFVVFDHWLTNPVYKSKPRAFILEPGFGPVRNLSLVDFRAFATPEHNISQYVWHSQIDGELYRGNNLSFSLGNLSLGRHYISLRVQEEDGNWSEKTYSELIVHNGYLNAVIDGISPAASLQGSLVTFSGYGEGNSSAVAWWWRSSYDGYLSNEASFNSSELSIGKHKITFQVRDEYGLWSPENESFVTILDPAARPAASITSVYPSQAEVGEPVTVNGTDLNGGTIVRFVWNLNGEELHNGSQSRFIIPELDQEENKLTLRMMDEHGRWSLKTSRTIYMTLRPTAVIVSIGEDLVNPGTKIRFVAAGQDNESIEMYTWRSDVDGFFYSGSEAAILEILSEGEHTIYLKVMNDKGVWSREVNNTINASDYLHDGAGAPDPGPHVSIDFPASGSTVSGLVTISGVVFYNEPQDYGTSAWVEVSIDGGKWKRATLRGNDPFFTDSFGWKYEWDTEKLKEKEYTIAVMTRDSNGGQSDIITINVEVEKGASFDWNSKEAVFACYLPVTMVLSMVLVYILYERNKQKPAQPYRGNAIRPRKQLSETAIARRVPPPRKLSSEEQKDEREDTGDRN